MEEKMIKSDSIKELASALSKLIGEIKDVPKNKKGRFDYADLEAMLHVARPLLEKHGLALTQLVGGDGSSITVETVLMHSSGEYISTIMVVPGDKGKSGNILQDIGGAITYAKRYMLSAMLCFVKSDDDNDGEDYTADTYAQKKSDLGKSSLMQGSVEVLTLDQVSKIDELIKQAGSDSVKLLSYYKIGSWYECPSRLYGAIEAGLLKKINEKSSINDKAKYLRA